MSEIHLLDLEEDIKVPVWEQNKLNGYKMAKCGYQRKYTTLDSNKATCKHCIKLID